MKKRELLEKVESLGYPLLRTEDLNANETLAEVVMSKDLRLWEGFPLLLANSLTRSLFSFEGVEKHLKSQQDRAYFQNLVLMSLALYEYLGVEMPKADALDSFEASNKKMFYEFMESFKSKKEMAENVKKLSPERMVNTFKSYFKNNLSELKEYTKMKDEYDLEYSLSQVFSKKQKELVFKKLKGEKMNKTESEYYSRSVKKKLLALANTNLHQLAVSLLKK